MTAKKIKSWVVAFTVVVLPLGCAIRKDIKTPFVDPKNKPVVDVPEDATHGTKYCSPDGNNKFDVNAVQIEGAIGAESVAWAEGGGCVARPIREVWAALQNLEPMRWDDTDRFTSSRVDHPNADFTHLYNITYYKSTIIGNIDWTIQWYHGFDLGTFDAPTRINISYQKVSGTSNITVWKGGITLSKVSNGMTSIGIRDELKARQGNSENLQSAKDAVLELTRKARTVPPDWTRLNTGFHDNPGEPDKPVAGRPEQPGKPGPVTGETICVKGRDGRYSAQPDFTFGNKDGSSWTRWRSCVNFSAEALQEAAKNHRSIKWRNAEKVTANPSGPSQISVSYLIDRWFKDDIAWNMIWDYAEAPLRSTFAIQPATAEFPVWTGTLQFDAVEASVSAISLDMQMLTDSPKDSMATNKSLAQGFITDLLNTVH